MHNILAPLELPRFSEPAFAKTGVDVSAGAGGPPTHGAGLRLACYESRTSSLAIFVYYVEDKTSYKTMNHAMIPTVDGALISCPNRIDASRRHGSLGLYMRAPQHFDYFLLRESKSQCKSYSGKLACRAARDKARDKEIRGVEQPELIRPPDRLVWTKFVAETLLPTSYGRFRVRGYRHTMDGGLTFTEPTAIMSGDVFGQDEIVVRVHDACFTSEVLGSLKCDCREQLQLALEYIQDRPPGMVIYLQQEGRGIGLANKIAAYALQEKGLDTVDANRALGLPDDCREYSAVGHILKDLNIGSIRLMTNNPRKINELEALGIKVVGRVPCQVKASRHNVGYLSAKQRRMQHMIEEEEGLQGQSCFWDHAGEPSSAGIPLETKLESRDKLQQPYTAAGMTSGAAATQEETTRAYECGKSSNGTEP